MRFKVSAEGAVNFVRRSVYLAFSWPLPVTATEFQKNKFTVLWYLTTLSILSFSFPLLYSVYEYRDNLFVVTTSMCFVAASVGALGKTIICRIHKEKIQSLTWEMESFLKIAQPPELKVLQSYVKICSGFHCTTIITSYLAAVFLICGPFFQRNHKFPTFAVYPFSIDSGLIQYFVYLHQSIGCVQVTAACNLDNQSALLLWYVGARFEMLAQELQTTRNCSDLIMMIKKHQHLLRLSKEATNVMSYIAFTIAVCGSIIVLTTCLILADEFSIAMTMQFGPFLFVGIAWIFVCAWPADNLINACNLVATAAYNSAWPDMSPAMKKNVLIVLQRSQRPVIVSIGGFIPILSLDYYRCYVSVAISYLMALRIIVGIDDA